VTEICVFFGVFLLIDANLIQFFPYIQQATNVGGRGQSDLMNQILIDYVVCVCVLRWAKACNTLKFSRIFDFFQTTGHVSVRMCVFFC
jgi:hypothetical protein